MARCSATRRAASSRSTTTAPPMSPDSTPRGDSCGTCFIGASYSGFGFATMHAAATGARAGLGAAKEAKRLGRSAAGAAGAARTSALWPAATARLLGASGEEGRLHAALGHPGAAEHPGPLLRALHQAGRPAADRPRHRGVPARPHRAQALRARRPRAAAGARDQEHGHQRGDEAALLAASAPRAGALTTARTIPAATTPSGWPGCGSRRKTAP